jgi:RimJ/RimL family protein N-acetyltransferase
VIVTDQPKIEAWVRERKSDADLNQWAGVAWEDENGIRCAVVYNHPAYLNINAHILSDGSKRWATREFLWAIFHYPFIQCKMNRISAPIAEGNLEARRFVEKLGFSLEGRMDGYRHDGSAQLIYGMLRKDCRWT